MAARTSPNHYLRDDGGEAALKDVGRAMDLPYGDVDRLAKLVPNQINITLDEAFAQSLKLARGHNESDERSATARDRQTPGRHGHATHRRTPQRCDFAATPDRSSPLQDNRDENHTPVDMKGLDGCVC